MKKDTKKEVILEAKKLNKEFINDKEVNKVLKDIDLEIYKGDFTIIMGASGSGKSTLLYCLSGMDKVTSGEIIYNNTCISGNNEKEMVKLRRGDFGFVFQQMHLVSNLTIFENVAVPGYLNRFKSSEDTNAKANELLNKVNLSNRVKQLPSQVSGGEQQRAAIARAMINEPKLLFADEPTGALNRKNTEDVLKLLSEINEAGQSIVAVSHDIKVAVHATRIIYLDDGTITGELNIGKYDAKNIKEREIEVSEWLTKLLW